MTPPQALVDALLMGAGSNSVANTLRMAGYTVTRSSLDTRISQLIAQGDRSARIAGITCPGGVTDINDAERGSRMLLARHLTTGQHWITDPVKFEEACEQVRQAA